MKKNYNNLTELYRDYLEENETSPYAHNEKLSFNTGYRLKRGEVGQRLNIDTLRLLFNEIEDKQLVLETIYNHVMTYQQKKDD